MKLILASASPRRKKILEKAGFEFEVIPSNADETTEEMPPDKLVLSLSLLKAKQIAEQNPGSIVIGADTIVSLGGEILQKPRSEDEAFSMLKRLSGHRHEVFTGVSIVSAEKEESFFSMTEVIFYKHTDAFLRSYVKTGEPMDKAGAYGIQERGSLLVKSIKGDYFNVMGLPVAELALRLERDYGVTPF